MRRPVGLVARLGVAVMLCLVASGCAQLGIDTGPRLADPVLVPAPPPAAPTPGAPAPGAPAPAAAPPGAPAPAPAPATSVIFAGRSGRWFADWQLVRVDLSGQSITWRGPKVTKGSQLAVAGDVVAAVKGTSLVVADLATGTQRFTKTLTGPVDTNCGTPREDPIVDVDRPCVTAVGNVIAVRLADAVVAFDTASGDERWRAPISKAYGPLTGAGVVATLYRLKDDTPQLLLIDPATGNPQQVPLTCPPGPGRPKDTVATQALLHESGTTITAGTGSNSGCLRQLELPSLKDRFVLNGGSTPGVTGLGELSLHGVLVVRPFNPPGGAPGGVTIITPDGHPHIVPLAPEQTTTEVGNSDGASVEVIMHLRADPSKKTLVLADMATGQMVWSRPLENVKHLAINPGPLELRCPSPDQCNVTALNRGNGQPLPSHDLPKGIDAQVLAGPTQLVFGGKRGLALVDPKTGTVVSAFDFAG